MNTDKERLKHMPVIAQQKWMKAAWERELDMRRRVLKGANQKAKVEEALICIEICERTIEHLRPPI